MAGSKGKKTTRKSQLYVQGAHSKNNIPHTKNLMQGKKDIYDVILLYCYTVVLWYGYTVYRLPSTVIPLSSSTLYAPMLLVIHSHCTL